MAQEARIGLLAAISRFDPTRGTTLAAYAHWFVRRAVFEAARSMHRDDPHRAEVEDMDQLSAALLERAGLDPHARVVTAERGQALLQAMDALAPRERTVIAVRFGLAGPALSLQDTALLIGSSLVEVRSIEGRALRKLGDAAALSVVA